MKISFRRDLSIFLCLREEPTKKRRKASGRRSIGGVCDTVQSCGLEREEAISPRHRRKEW